MKDTKPVKLTSASDTIEGEMITNLLKSNDIPSYKLEQCTGNYMNIYMGYSVYGEDIYVDEKDYEKAKEIIKNLQIEEYEEETEKISEQKIWTRKRLAACITVGIIFGVPILLCIIINLL